jgi:hypothetical protein
MATKPCPQCGAALHFVAQRWMHAVPGHCLLITLLATPDEISQHGHPPTLPGARYRKADAAADGEWKFSYLAHGTGD